MDKHIEILKRHVEFRLSVSVGNGKAGQCSSNSKSPKKSSYAVFHCLLATSYFVSRLIETNRHDRGIAHRAIPSQNRQEAVKCPLLKIVVVP